MYKRFDIDEIEPVEKLPFYPCMCIVQARMGSTRLPGKVLKKVLGKPLLLYLVERLHRIGSIEGLIIATTTEPADDEIYDFCTKESLHCVRGSVHDVLSRYHAVAAAYGLKVAIRVTADCPLIDPKVIEQGLFCFAKHYDSLDYLSNTLDRRFARGMDFEIFKTQALEKAYFEATSSYDTEHVTPYIVKNPKLFSLANLGQKQDESSFRLTVDVEEDFVLVQHIIEALYPKKRDFDRSDIQNLLKKHPEWVMINQNVIQKL